MRNAHLENRLVSLHENSPTLRRECSADSLPNAVALDEREKPFEHALLILRGLISPLDLSNFALWRDEAFEDREESLQGNGYIAGCFSKLFDYEQDFQHCWFQETMLSGTDACI